MRLAINLLSVLQGGGQIYISKILRYAKDFPDIKIYAFAPPQFADLFSYPEIEIIPCSVPSKSTLHRIFWERWRLPKLLKELKIDLVFCPGGTINFSPPKGCLTAVTFQNMLIFNAVEMRKYPLFSYMRVRLELLKRISINSFKKANLVIFISNYAKKVIDEIVPIRKGVSIVISHGLDDVFRTFGRDDIPRSIFLPDGDYFLYASLLHDYKAHVEVVHAYHILCQKRSTDEKLLFVGPEYPPYGRLVRKKIEQLGLKDKVIIVGKIPYADMPSLYHYAKANIFASTCENCPNIVLESLGSGRPLFLSNRPPMSEFAKDSAIYFDPYNPNMLAQLISEVIDDNDRINKLGHAAYLNSLNYSWEDVANKTFQMILELKSKHTI